MPFNANFFWATFFVLLVPHEFSTGACPTPSGLEFVKTHHCVVGGCKKVQECADVIYGWSLSYLLLYFVASDEFDEEEILF